MPTRGVHAASSTTLDHINDNDLALLRRIAARDRQAFEQLYNQYACRLAGYLARILWQPDQVEDILHDVMLAIWQQAPAYEPTGRVSTWIFGIAKYKAFKARASAPRQYPERLPALPNAPDEEILEEGLMRQERARAVTAALATLRPEQRAVVELTYYHHCSYQEIAAIMDCPVNTVKTRMLKARRHLIAHFTRLGLPSL